MKTFETTLTLPESVTFTRAGHEVTFSLATLSPDILAQLVAHGLTQKAGDSAAGKSGDEALAKMHMTYNALAEGDWGVRRSAAPGMTALEAEMINLIIKALPPFPKGTARDTKVEKAQETLAKMSEAQRATYEKVAQRNLDVAKEAKEMLAGLSLTL